MDFVMWMTDNPSGGCEVAVTASIRIGWLRLGMWRVIAWKWVSSEDKK